MKCGLDVMKQIMMPGQGLPTAPPPPGLCECRLLMLLIPSFQSRVRIVVDTLKSVLPLPLAVLCVLLSLKSPPADLGSSRAMSCVPTDLDVCLWGPSYICCAVVLL